jgi:hypothetical protein
VLGEDAQLVGERDMEGADDDCEELASSMAIAISILLDPFGSVRRCMALEFLGQVYGASLGQNCEKKFQRVAPALGANW